LLLILYYYFTGTQKAFWRPRFLGTKAFITKSALYSAFM